MTQPFYDCMPGFEKLQVRVSRLELLVERKSEVVGLVCSPALLPTAADYEYDQRIVSCTQTASRWTCGNHDLRHGVKIGVLFAATA